MSKKVMLTGASGYIGSWICRTLLQEGHTVHATVRDPSNPKKVKHLKQLALNTPGTLELFKADLLEDGSFDEACVGCDAVIHSASPFIIGKYKDVQKQLLDPAKKGTRNVLNAASKAETVGRVVVTSSMAAMYGDNSDILDYEDKTITEKCWNTTSTDKHNAYSYSKTIAEKEAWKLAAAADWDLAIINPGFVMGPSLSQRKDGTSMEVMLSLLNGRFKQGVPNVEYALVDVRNIAEAHVKALSTPETGRFLMAQTSGTFLRLAEEIEKAFPGKYKLPKSHVPKILMYLLGPSMGFSWKYVTENYKYPMKFSNERASEVLKIDWIPIEKTVRDHVNQIEKNNLLS